MTPNTDYPDTSLAAHQQRALEWTRLPWLTRAWKKTKVLLVVSVWALLGFTLAAIITGATDIHAAITFGAWGLSILGVARLYTARLGVPYSIF